MASMFKKTTRKPIPDGAEIITRKGRKCARFVNKQGKKLTHPLTDDGQGTLTTTLVSKSTSDNSLPRTLTLGPCRERSVDVTRIESIAPMTTASCRAPRPSLLSAAIQNSHRS